MNEWQWRLVFDLDGVATIVTVPMATTTTPDAPDDLLKVAAALSGRLGVGIDVQRQSVGGLWVLDHVVHDLPPRSEASITETTSI